VIVKIVDESNLNKVVELEKSISGKTYSSIGTNNLSFALFDKEEVIGTISFQIVIDEADVLYFCIDKNYRGLGLSKILFNDSLEFLKKKNIKTIFLEVSNLNLVAYNLYKKLDFIEISRREKYYSDNSNAIVMKKTIC